jgi:hypothetical protein
VKFANLAIIVTAASALTACTSAPATPKSEVPSVDLPDLSLSKYVGKPCLVFGVDQLDSLGVTGPGMPDPEQSTSRCRWTSGPKGSFGISLFGEAQGLARVYASRQAFPYFEPTSVASYPAVDRDAGRATTGTCATVVGIADGAAFEVDVDVADPNSTDYVTPCAVSKQVAAIAVANIQGGG